MIVSVWRSGVIKGSSVWACFAVVSVATVAGCDTQSSDSTFGASGAAETEVSTEGGQPGDTSDASTSASGEEEVDDDADAGTDDSSATGVSFLADPDGGGTNVECSLWDQDCPEGEKCSSWSTQGSAISDATRCVPVSQGAGQPGDPCTVEQGGVDSCAIGADCWNVDGATGEGVCVALCTGSEAAPICDNPAETCAIANDGTLILCLPLCDPLLQDCPTGEGCYYLDQQFICAPDTSGTQGGPDSPCDAVNACDPGLRCVPAGAASGCPAGSTGCCRPYCDMSAADVCGVGETCESAFAQGNAPPGAENVGICLLP
jgi:hypothetical protein